MISVHPANKDVFLRSIGTATDKTAFDALTGVPVYFDSRVPKHPMGYRLPDGSIVNKGELELKDNWVTFGPEDAEYLLYAGIIHEAENPNEIVVWGMF